jgi:hypothetical protein
MKQFIVSLATCIFGMLSAGRQTKEKVPYKNAGKGFSRRDAMLRVSTMQYTIPSHDNIVSGKRKYLNVNNIK